MRTLAQNPRVKGIRSQGRSAAKVINESTMTPAATVRAATSFTGLGKLKREPVDAMTYKA